MSRTETEPIDSTDPQFRAMFAEPPELGLSDLGTLGDVNELVDKTIEWQMPVTHSRARRALDSGDLASFMVCAKRRVSTRDLFYWLMSMRRTPNRREQKRVSA